jgi:hypothetical protein
MTELERLKVRESNHLPAKGNDRFPVYAKQFNNLIDALAEGTINLDVEDLDIDDDLTIGGDATVAGVLAVTGGISQGTLNVKEFTVLTTLTASEIVGTAAGDLGHASGAVLVAAPGSGYALEFVNAIAIYDFDTAAYTGGGNDTTINLGSGGAVITGVVTSANLLGAAGDKIVRFEPLSTAALPVSVNVPISMNSVTAWTQPGTAAGVLRVYTTYRLFATGL